MSTEHGTPELPPLPVDFRPAKTRAVLLAAAVAIFVVVSAVALLLDSLSPAEKTSFVFTAALLAGILVLLARPRVRADEDGVTVVNITRVRRLAWAEIVRVNLRTGDCLGLPRPQRRHQHAGPRHPARQRPRRRRPRRPPPARPGRTPLQRAALRRLTRTTAVPRTRRRRYSAGGFCGPRPDSTSPYACIRSGSRRVARSSRPGVCGKAVSRRSR